MTDQKPQVTARPHYSDLPDRLGEFFTLDELIRTSQPLPNVPTEEQRRNLRELVRLVLDPLRRRLRKPIIVTSGFRSVPVNRAVGGSPRSLHLQGLAADIKVNHLNAADIIAALHDSNIDFDQAIGYALPRGGHTHVQVRLLAPNRRDLLWAPASISGYLPYTAGVTP